MFLIPTVTYATSAQWDPDPITGTGDWNTAANWTPDEVPNAPEDIATFGRSNMTDVSISKQIEVNGIIFTSEATNPNLLYTITVNPGPVELTISGTGTTNNSSFRQNFVSAGGGADIRTGGRIAFTNNASASNTLFTAEGATVSGASGGVTSFLDNSRAANGIFFSNGATVSGAGGGFTAFGADSHADSAGLIAFGGVNGGQGGTILFQGNSDGGTSRVEVRGNGTLDLSNHNSGIFRIGSIEGDGKVFVGGADVSLLIGGNNRDATFSGVIEGRNGGAELRKQGTGTLTLAKDSVTDFLGDNDIDSGVLQVDGSFTTGNTFVMEHATLAGSGTVQNKVVVGARGKVRPGSDGVTGRLTVDGDYSESELATLIIQIASVDDFSVLAVTGLASLAGTLQPMLNNFIPAPGNTFTFLSYGSLDGEFSRIENEIFAGGTLQWLLSDDQTTLTVVSRASPVPDQGSTFLLLTLGLLGLTTYRRQLLRGQP
jgi:hypothetical protein